MPPQYKVVPICRDEAENQKARKLINRLIAEGWRVCNDCGSYENKLYASDHNIDHFVFLEREEEISADHLALT